MTDETITPQDLPARWRERAEDLRHYGVDPPAARVWELAADELERVQRAFGATGLTLVDAARVSGYTSDHLGDLVRAGKIPNAGRPNAPLIRRADLPIKAGNRGRPRKSASGQDKLAAVREIAANIGRERTR
jgi:hypothetical protein